MTAFMQSSRLKSKHAVLWAMAVLGIACVVAGAQKPDEDPRICARKVGDTALPEWERRENAHTLVKVATVADLSRIFYAIKIVAGRLDDHENERRVLDRRIAVELDTSPKTYIGRPLPP